MNLETSLINDIISEASSAVNYLPENDTNAGCNDTLNRGTPSSWLVGSSTPIVAAGFCYSADTENYTTWQNRPDSSVDCAVSLPLAVLSKAKSRGAKTLSILIDTSCNEKFNNGAAAVSGGYYAIGDSILVEYVETCYDTAGAYNAFIYLNGSSFGPSTNPTTYVKFREWLKSVLWLAPMYPGWYCYCADDILGSYEGIDAGDSLNNALAILRYLDSLWPLLTAIRRIPKLLTLRHMRWIDTVNALHQRRYDRFSSRYHATHD